MHTVGRLLAFSQLHVFSLPKKKKKKKKHGLPRVNRFMVSFKSVQLHLGGLVLDVFSLESKRMNYSGIVVVNSPAVSDQFLWCHIS